MLRSYLKTALRSLLRSRGYALVNIVGLALGVAAVGVIADQAGYELSFDSFHRDADRIYRVSVVSYHEGKQESDSPEFTPPLGPAMRAAFPDVEEMTRVTLGGTSFLSAGAKTLKTNVIAHADSTFFSIFSFRLLSGDPATALAEPYSIVLTRDLAGALFGSEDPLGRLLTADGKEQYRVTGVVEDPPANSHLQFSALVAFSTLYRIPHLFLGWDGGHRYITYVKLRPGAKVAGVNEKFPGLLWEPINRKYASFGARLAPYLQPLKEIHLSHEPGSASLRSRLKALTAIGVLVLFVACANFVNLATARAARRAREVGIRKVLGADRRQLIVQFMGEALLFTALSCLLAVALIEVSAPWVMALTGHRPFSAGADAAFLLPVFAAIFLLAALAAGAYPALYLSSMPAARVVAEARPGRRGGRRALVLLQFAVSIALIICTLVIALQLRFISTKELGFARENMLILPLVGDEVQARAAALKAELAKTDGVADVTASSDIPHSGFTSNGYIPEGLTNPVMIHVVDVDDAFLSTYGIRLLSGRNFLPHAEGEPDQGFLVNEALARRMGWSDPVGKTIARDGRHTVVGVVRDFNFASLHEEVAPLIMTNAPWRGNFAFLTLRLKGEDLPGTLKELERRWHAVLPSVPFDLSFLDQEIEMAYRSERRFGELFLVASALAVAIALVGLLGLTAYATEQRTKEIGIRKVLGASAAGVAGLLSRELVVLVVGANLLAWPAAWYLMQRWLEDFAYRVPIEWWIFALSGGAALILALAAVSSLALKAALANPIEALRYE